MKRIEVGLWLISVLVIGLAAYEYYASQQQLTAYTWIPVYQSISTNDVADYKYSFTADKDTQYYIYLDVERQRDFEKLQCLIGAAFLRNQCAPEASRLDMDWEVLTSNAAIATGSTRRTPSTHSYWTQNVGKGVGEFAAHKGTLYAVNLHLHQALPELMVLHPKIKIAMHPLEFQAAQHTANITGLITVSLVAFVVLSLAGFYFYKEHRHKTG